MKSLQILGIVGFAASMTGCVPDWARENETGLLMEIAGITGVAGGEAAGSEGAILFSNVASAVNDDALVLVNIYRKNPTVESTSPLEHVRLESYQVRYFRSDGLNVEGVDVPHRITGPLNSLRFHTPTGVDEIEISAVVNIVRQTAKREPPLVNLIGVSTEPFNGRQPGAGFIVAVAEITVFARQITTGEPLTATGRLQVGFADFGADVQQ